MNKQKETDLEFGTRYFQENAEVWYLSDHYSVAYFTEAADAGKAVAMLIDWSIGFHTMVGPGEIWIIVDECSFTVGNAGFRKELEAAGISHHWIKSHGEKIGKIGSEREPQL